MDFLKTFIGSVIFTAVVLLFINVAGNVLVGKSYTVSNDAHEVVKAQPHAETQAPSQTETMAATPAPESQATTPTTPTAESVSTPSPAMVASGAGDAQSGADTFRKKCLSCHPVSDDGQNRTGPNLFGVIGRAKGSMEGFRYSSAMEKLGGVWSEAEINTFIAGPRVMVPETKMTFAGLKKQEQRDDIVAYLKTLSK